MARLAKLLSKAFAGAGNLAFLFAFVLGVACAESSALPSGVALLKSWPAPVVACSTLLLGGLLHAIAFALGTPSPLARPSAQARP